MKGNKTAGFKNFFRLVFVLDRNPRHPFSPFRYSWCPFPLPRDCTCTGLATVALRLEPDTEPVLVELELELELEVGEVPVLPFLRKGLVQPHNIPTNKYEKDFSKNSENSIIFCCSCYALDTRIRAYTSRKWEWECVGECEGGSDEA
jgi:hypothetical protein